MKSKVFLYLFLFALLFIVYQYMNEKKIFESQDNKIESLTSRLTKANAKSDSLASQVMDLDYFTLLGNDNAMSYFERLGFEAVDVENLVSEQIYEQNFVNGDNPLIPYEGVKGQMKINKIKFLNHRWVLADFTDGTYWGEIVLEYFFNEKNELELTTISSVLYPN